MTKLNTDRDDYVISYRSLRAPSGQYVYQTIIDGVIIHGSGFPTVQMAIQYGRDYVKAQKDADENNSRLRND